MMITLRLNLLNGIVNKIKFKRRAEKSVLFFVPNIRGTVMDYSSKKDATNKVNEILLSSVKRDRM